MITFEGTDYYTTQEVDESINAATFTEVELNNIRIRRTYYLRKYDKFANVDGVQIVYKKDQDEQEGFSDIPCIYFGGIVMDTQYSKVTKGTPVELRPAFRAHWYEDRQDALIVVCDKMPQKVGKPTPRKLTEWAEWGRLYIDTAKKIRKEITERTERNIAMLKAVEGMRVENDEDRVYSLTRGGVTARIYIHIDGSIGHTYQCNYSELDKLFADIMEQGVGQ